MALKTHQWGQTLIDASGVAVVPQSTQTISGDVEANFLVDVPPSSTVQVDLAVTVADIQSGYIVSDKDLTVNTNAANAAGGQSIVLVANIPFLWNTAKGGSNPFTPNITKFYCINASSTDTARVRGGFLTVA